MGLLMVEQELDGHQQGFQASVNVKHCREGGIGQQEEEHG